MATEIKLPRLGQGMESGTVLRWLKQEGERVEKGEPLYELDTEKVTQEVEADASGVLLKIAVQEGEVPVGQTVAVIGEEGEQMPEEEATPDRVEPEEEGAEIGAEKPAEGPAREDERRRGREAVAEVVEPELREPQRDGRVKASPLARRIARERGVDHARIRGTGPEGRIVAEDVERAEVAPAEAPAAAPVAPLPGEVEVVPLTSIRKTIARRLTEAWQAPVFQISMSADMTRALELRGRLVELAQDGPKPTVSDVLTKIAASALMRHRRLNAEFVGEEVRIHPTAGSSCPSSAARSGCRSRRSSRPAPTSSSGLTLRSFSRPTSRAAPSRSRTSACTASRSSSPSSTRRRSRSSP